MWSKCIFQKKYFEKFSKMFFRKIEIFIENEYTFFEKVRKKSKLSPIFFQDFRKFVYSFSMKMFGKFRFSEKYFWIFFKIFFLKNKFRSQKNNIFLWNFIFSHPMSRPSSSCIFGSIGPVEVFERGSYIFLILLCFLKKPWHTLLRRIIYNILFLRKEFKLWFL